MSRRIARLLRFALVLAVASLGNQAQTLFCRRSGIEGQSGPAAKAKQYLPGNTNNFSKMGIYVSLAEAEMPSVSDPNGLSPGAGLPEGFNSLPLNGGRYRSRDIFDNAQLYVHSNYVSHGAEYPTKMLTPERIEYAATLVPNLMGDDDFKAAGVPLDDPERLHLPVKLFIDQAVLLNRKYGRMNFTGFDQLFVVGRDGQAREAAMLESDTGQIAIRYHNSLFAKPDVDDAARLFGHLRDEPLNRDKVRLMVLVTNTDTQNAAAAIPGSHLVTFDFRSGDDWKSKFAQHPNTTFVVVGHVENGAFVALDPEQNELLRVELRDLESAAKINGIDLIALGCNTAGLTSSSTGVDSKFNTVDAVKRVGLALKAKNKLDFLDALAPTTDNIKIVLDQEALREDKREIQMRVISGGGAAALAVGSITLTGLATALGEPIDGDSRHYLIPAAGLCLGVGTVVWWRRRSKDRAVVKLFGA